MPGQQGGSSGGGGSAKVESYSKDLGTRLGVSTQVTVVDEIDTGGDDIPQGATVNGKYDPKTDTVQITTEVANSPDNFEAIGYDHKTTADMGGKAVIAHEMFHAVDGGYDRTHSWSREFRGLFNAAKTQALDGDTSHLVSKYSLSSTSEFFAECGAVYELNPSALESRLPEVYSYFQKVVPLGEAEFLPSKGMVEILINGEYSWVNTKEQASEGGSGSGNFGHAGVPGTQGGSSGSGLSTEVRDNLTSQGATLHSADSLVNQAIKGGGKLEPAAYWTFQDGTTAQMPQDVRHADSAPGIAKAMGLEFHDESSLTEAGVIRLYVQGRRDNQPWAMDFPYEGLTRAQSDLYKDLAATRNSSQITIWTGTAPKGWGLEKAWERGFLFELSVGQDLPDIKAEYQETLAYTMLDYLTEPEGRPITAFRNEFRQAVDAAFNASFFGGWGDAAKGAEVPDEARSWVEDKINAEIEFADSLWQDLKQMRKDMPADEVADWIWTRAENYTHTLDGIYDQGKIWGALEMPLTFGGDDGDETCDTCQRLKGQTYPAKWWVEHELIPGQAGNENFDCKGYRCQHVLLDPEGEVYSAESAAPIVRELWYLYLFEGGAGSGNFGHSGIDGQQGGSIGRAVGGQGVTADDRVLFTFSKSSWPKEESLSKSYSTQADSVGRSGTKAQVVSQLSERSGLSEEQVNGTVKTWAESSNDHNPLSNALQVTASEHFGTELSAWQKENAGEVEEMNSLTRQYIQERRDYLDAVDADDIEGQNAHWEEMQKLEGDFADLTERFGVGSTDEGGMVEGLDIRDYIPKVKDTDEYSEGMDRFVGATYEGTQEYLAGQGYSQDDELILYRGFHSDDPLDFGDAEYVGNALESWSTDPYVAEHFGQTIIAARVPMSRVFSTPLTGPGCLTEDEVIIVGGVMQVVVVKSQGRYEH